MKKTLYLMVGYPGAGKTTTAEIIAELTGATHLWADRIRRERYGQPTYSHQENTELYDHLNELTGELLEAGNSVVFDTNFNFYKDRQKLREIAAKHNANTLVVWVQAPTELAKKRATMPGPEERTRILGKMPEEHFLRISNNLQPPQEDEKTVVVDGTKVNKAYVQQLLNNLT